MKYIYTIVLFIVSFIVLFYSIEFATFMFVSLNGFDDPSSYYNSIAFPLLGALLIVCTKMIMNKINSLCKKSSNSD